MNELVQLPPQEAEIRQQFRLVLRKKLVSKQILIAVGAILTLAALLPVAIAAVQAGLALILVGALVALGITSWKMLPWWILAVENRVRERVQAEENRSLAAMKKEASQNPIEQAQNDYLRRSRQIEDFKGALEQIVARVSSFKARLERTKRERPNFDLRAETEALAKMEEFCANRLQRLTTAVEKLGRFKDKIEEARTKWEFQLAANAAIRAMNETDRDAQINEILTQVAFGTVQQEFDAIFAKLDVDAAEIRGTKALEFGGASIDLSTIGLNGPELVPARATNRG